MTEKSATNSDYIWQLSSELAARQERNVLYSMRAFAKALGLSAGVLSLIINGKRIPSLDLATKLANKLDLSPAQRFSFIDSVVRRQQLRCLKRVDPNIREHKFSPLPTENSHHARLETEYYHTISDWYNITILEMTRLKDFKYSNKWIASQLGIAEIEVKLAIKRLLDLGLVEEFEGTIRAHDRQLRLDEMYNITSAARRKKQKQIREKSIECIDNITLDKRSMTSMTMCADISLIPQAKKIIEKFNEEICALLESGQKEKVYAVEVSLFPLQKE